METQISHSANPPKHNIVTVGTLTYNRQQLIKVFLWLLFGALWLAISGCVGPAVITLKIKDLGASNTLASFILAAIPAIANFAVHPTIAYRSDRLRSKWGRRIPFLFLSAPILGGLLIAMAFCDSIAPVFTVF